MYKLYGWHYYILLLSAIIFVLLCHDFLAWMGSRILTKKKSVEEGNNNLHQEKDTTK